MSQVLLWHGKMIRDLRKVLERSNRRLKMFLSMGEHEG